MAMLIVSLPFRHPFTHIQSSIIKLIWGQSVIKFAPWRCVELLFWIKFLKINDKWYERYYFYVRGSSTDHIFCPRRQTLIDSYKIISTRIRLVYEIGYLSLSNFWEICMLRDSTFSVIKYKRESCSDTLDNFRRSLANAGRGDYRFLPLHLSKHHGAYVVLMKGSFSIEFYVFHFY